MGASIHFITFDVEHLYKVTSSELDRVPELARAAAGPGIGTQVPGEMEEEHGDG